MTSYNFSVPNAGSTCTNPMKSTFFTVKLRTKATRGPGTAQPQNEITRVAVDTPLQRT